MKNFKKQNHSQNCGKAKADQPVYRHTADCGFYSRSTDHAGGDQQRSKNDSQDQAVDHTAKDMQRPIRSAYFQIDFGLSFNGHFQQI